jgi:hypothetical protein
LTTQPTLISLNDIDSIDVIKIKCWSKWLNSYLTNYGQNVHL